MKVCLLTNMHAPNDDRIYFKEALSLLKRYPDLTVMAPVKGGNGQFRGSVRFYPLRISTGKVGRLLSIITAVRSVRRLSPDVCHFHDYDLILSVPFLRILTHAKLIYDSHEAYPESILISYRIPRFLRKLAAFVANFLEKSFARLCDVIITADNATRDSFLQKGLPAVTIFNYPPLQIFQRDREFETQLKAKYNNRKLIIYQGTMGKYRGLHHMIRAMSTLKESEPSILLLLVGLNNQSLRRETDQLIKEQGVKNHVQIIPWVEHTKIGSYMRISKIGLIPWQPVAKHMKNIPIKVFEYMACGVPILAADLPPIAHYINASRAGRLYDSTNVKALAEGVLNMLEDDEELERMSQNGLRATIERWNWEKMEARLFLVYEGIERSMKPLGRQADT